MESDIIVNKAAVWPVNHLPGINMNQSQKKPVAFLKALLSILSAALGVQKRENMERDLNASNPAVYIISGIIFLVLFIGGIATVVSVVVPK